MFEPVDEIVEYFDGPRQGKAYFLSVPCSFKSQWKDVYGEDGTSDVFEITPLSGSQEGATLLATGCFRSVDEVIDGEWPKFEVEWRTVES